VDVGDEEVFTPLNERKPSTLTVMAARKSTNAIAKAFTNERTASLFLFEGMRPVKGIPSASGQEAFKVEELLLTDPRIPVWVEADMGANVGEMVAEMRKDEKKLEARLAKGQVGVAVAVTEKGGPNPLAQVPGHESMAGQEDKPRMVVFGDSNWISNEGINGRFGETHTALFNSSLSWLRDRKDLGEKPKGQERKEYRFSVGEETVTRLKYLPLAMMLLSVVGLGGAIWIVRRR